MRAILTGVRQFWFAFPSWLMMLDIFPCIYWTFVFLHLKSVCSVAFLIYWWGCLLFIWSLVIFLYIFWIWIPYQTNMRQNVLSFSRLSLYSVD
jgi:hypothetical protein